MLGRLAVWAVAHKVIASVCAVFAVIVVIGGVTDGTPRSGSAASPARPSAAGSSSVPETSSASPASSDAFRSAAVRSAAGREPPAVVAPAPAITTTPATATTPAATVAAQPGSAATLLATLAIKGRAPMTGYSRGEFGQAWADTDRNGCDTRNDVLRRDLTAVAIQPGTNGCVVASGELADPYTGTSIQMSRGAADLVQIDHVVALGDAWQTGAQYWPDAERVALANDPLNLLAVQGAANEQKGDSDAASWLPANKAFRCAYVARQVAVKAKYELWVTRAEHDAIAAILGGCPAESAPAGGNSTIAPFGTSSPPGSTAPSPPVSPLPTTGPAAAGALACTAAMSNAHPAQYSTTDVVVHTAAGASVGTVAHYKTKDTEHTATADGSGVADVPYPISGATVGFPVAVDVTVNVAGRSAACSTSFTPVAR